MVLHLFFKVRAAARTEPLPVGYYLAGSCIFT